ncbi:MAG TPA: DNA replication/repair protein RecF [Povalibacter sp.]|uniref:DNA replication/repair protein RecF n=1 Tax=Povalibacter sp. TaxID=1962978 RepID=UPI002C0DA084|nr:DNA replication/repair protein RecF [Povalibacter sp.]HMN46325.1 DNA replication/repair protein RecF [Povalibacter sp.]
MLSSIDIENFRCIERARLEFDPRGTGILGRNASGKTSLLEAIFFLGHARSLRANTREKLVRRGESFFRIVAEIDAPRGILTAGTEFVGGRSQTRLAGHGISSISEIAEILPIQLIDPSVHRLIEEGSARRRRLMDWGVFHVEHNFLAVWRRYQRALLQRNAAFRAGQTLAVVSAWEGEMAECGEAVDRYRGHYVAMLRPVFEQIAGKLLGEAATFEYRRGWAADQSLSDEFAAKRPRDQQLRTTTVGPHRSDLTFRVDGTLARDRISRGQQKLLACALILAQVQLRSVTAQVPTTLLLDDPAAELDVDNLGKLLEAIDSVPSQLIVTSVSEAGLKGVNVRRTFHVEQGRFTPML